MVQQRDIYVSYFIVFTGAVLVGVLLIDCIVSFALLVCYCIVLVGILLLGHSGSGDSSDRGGWDSLALPTHLLMDAQH